MRVPILVHRRIGACELPTRLAETGGGVSPLGLLETIGEEGIAVMRVRFPDPVARYLDDVAKAPVGIAPGILLGRGGKLAVDGRNEPRQVALEDEVRDAFAH